MPDLKWGCYNCERFVWCRIRGGLKNVMAFCRNTKQFVGVSGVYEGCLSVIRCCDPIRDRLSDVLCGVELFYRFCLLWSCLRAAVPDAKQDCRDCEQFVRCRMLGTLEKRYGVLLEDKTVCLCVWCVLWCFWAARGFVSVKYLLFCNAWIVICCLSDLSVVWLFPDDEAECEIELL